MDWLKLLAVQEILKSFLQQHSSKAWILQCSAFFVVQISHPYMTTRKTIALTRWTFVGKVTSLLFNMLSRLAIAFLPRSKHLLITWLQSTIHNDFGAQENKICHYSNIFSSICHDVMGLEAVNLVFWMLNFKPAFSLFSSTFTKRLFKCSSWEQAKVSS